MIAKGCTPLFLLLAMLGCNSSSPPPANGALPLVNPADYVAGIDNPFLPLVPGTTMVYESDTADGLERTTVEVTSQTQTILGVTCIVVRDTVTLDGELVEDTFDWYAQDQTGNVWYFGEDSRSYEGGVVVSTEGSWEAGVDGAEPGIVMEAHPQVGDSYRQEYLAGVAEDEAEVLGLDASVTVPAGTFTGCIETADTTPLEPNLLENKYYAPGIGTVLETEENGTVRVELVEIRHN